MTTPATRALDTFTRTPDDVLSGADAETLAILVRDTYTPELMPCGAALDAARKLSRLGLAEWRIARGYAATEEGRALFAELRVSGWSPRGEWRA